MIIMTCSIAFNFNSFLINIQYKQAEQMIHTVDTHIKQKNMSLFVRSNKNKDCVAPLATYEQWIMKYEQFTCGLNAQSHAAFH